MAAYLGCSQHFDQCLALRRTRLQLLASGTFMKDFAEVISMLLDPNLNSPANIDAAVHLKNDPEGWKKKVLG